MSPGYVVTVAGHTVELADYATVDLAAVRLPPLFGELPGDRDQHQHRWPDILRWYVLTDASGAAHDVLHELRVGSRHMTRMLADTLVTGLHVLPQDRVAVIDMITATHFGDIDSEWALTNLIDAAVEIAADVNEQLAEAWARTARERAFTGPSGAPL